MAANRKPRRPYDPDRRARSAYAGAAALADVSPLTETYLVNLSLGIHAAFEMIRRGGDEDAWHTLAQAANISLVLAERGFGEEYIEAIKSAQQALMRARARASSAGKWGFDGTGISDMRTLVELHDRQMEIATRATVREVIREMNRRMEAGDTLESAA